MIKLAWAFPKDRLMHYKRLCHELIDHNNELIHHFVSSKDELICLVPDVVITNQYDWVLDYCLYNTQLRWVHFMSAGVDKAISILKGLKSSELIVTNVRGIHEECMRNYVFSWIFADSQNLLFNYRNQVERKWVRKHSLPLAGQTIMIYGYGSIGKSIGKFALGLGMKVIGIVNNKKISSDNETIITFDEVASYSKHADYFIISAPLTNLTYKSLSKEFFSGLEKSPMLINISRSEILNDVALKDAINTGVLRAAVLDVHDREPLDEDSDFWGMKNTYLTPHISGYTLNGMELGVRKLNELIKSFLTSEISPKDQISIKEGY